jgi:hypothetical protein
MDMGQHQVHQSLTVRRGDQRSQRAQRIKTLILLKVGVAHTSRTIVNHRCQREVDISCSREVVDLVAVAEFEEADIVGGDVEEPWQHHRWRHD